MLSRGKRVVLCHVVSNEGFVNGAFLLCEKYLSDSFLDYRDDMNGKVYEIWFESVLLPKLPKERNVERNAGSLERLYQ